MINCAPLPPELISTVLQRGVRDGHLDGEHTAAIYLDKMEMLRRVGEVQRCFPGDALHATAVKANPLPAILRQLVAAGNGLEVASEVELLLALESGCPKEKIVFDSPAKTVRELELALKNGIHVNVDNFEELARVANIIKAHHLEQTASVGLRINPQVGESAIADVSTAGAYSKFGITLSDNKAAIKSAFINNKWLNTIHIHVGSQLADPELIIRGSRMVLDLALDLQELGATQLKTINIGGGFPADYRRDDGETYQFDTWIFKLKTACPQLFDKFRIVTEYGRFIHADAGWIVSRVEYVKEQAESVTAIIHVGADLLIRECYKPDQWYHDVFVCDDTGVLVTDREKIKQQIAGPLCFSGDFPARNRMLPHIQPNDIIVIAEAGAYTFSMASDYNSRPMPRIIQYTEDEFEELKKRETPEDVMNRWR